MTKKIASGEIVLQSDKETNVSWLQATNALRHPSSYEMYLSSEQRKRRSSFYAFKIFATNFIKKPVFRFDSDGSAHRNDLDDIPLSERLVKTPHFHSFRDDGNEIAFRTNEIEKDEKLFLNDINYGFCHFCEKAKIVSDDGSVFNVVQYGLRLKVHTNDKIDVHKGIEFK